MLNHLDNYFFSVEEPHRSCLLFLRGYILNFSDNISEKWKFNTPFYYFSNKWLCYISYHKKTKIIYVGFVHGYKIKHSKLLSEGRKQVKVFYINPEKDIAVKSLQKIFKMATDLVKK
jgi:hypothetical protein